MPFAQPNLPFSFGSRVGATDLVGTFAPSSAGSTSRISANIGAHPPFGTIGATCSWGFNAGFAPSGSSTLMVSVGGLTFERAFVFALGGYSHAHAEISITIEEFRPNSTGGLDLVRAATNGPTVVFDHWAAIIGYQVRVNDGTAGTFMVASVTPGRSYRWWINAVQTATCQGVSGAADARSNFAFDFAPVFFAFT